MLLLPFLLFTPLGCIGPLCVWNNVSARCYSPPGSEYGEFASFIKMGYAEDVDGMTGQMYIFNNTILQPNGEGAGGLGSSLDTDVEIFQCVTRNNRQQTFPFIPGEAHFTYVK